MFIRETELKSFIIDSGLVSKKDMAEAEKEAVSRKISLGEVLVNDGKLGEDDLRKIQAHVSGVSFVDLKDQTIDLEALRLIPEPLSRKHNIIAFKRTPEHLEVAMLDMDALEEIDFLREKLGVKILSRLTNVGSIKSALLKYQRSLKAEFGDFMKRERKAVEMVDALFKNAVSQHASDIHIEPGEKDFLVRYRIGGIMHDAMVLPKSSWISVMARIKGLACLKIDENRFPQDGRFKAEMGGEKMSVRVSVLPTFHGEKAVISISKENTHGFTLEKLGFHGESLERVHNALKFRTGMIVVAGPHRSGKSATLYSMIDILNNPKVSISTIEDPVRSQIARVNQVQVRADIGLSFAQGLRSAIRQDSDIIMVSDASDVEVASVAANAVLAGRLVLVGMPARSASLGLSHLMDMKIEPLLITSTLSTVVGQRLARKLSQARVRKPLTRAELGALGKIVDLDRMLGLLRAERVIGPKDGWGEVSFGSPKVTPANDGYEGYVGIQEVLVMSPTMKSLVMKGASRAELEARAKREGMITMLEDGIFKAAQGQTTIEEVLRVLSE